MDVRCEVDEEYWCMQWSGEVLPEPAMIPDLSVFLRATPAYKQAVMIGERGQISSFHETRAEVFKNLTGGGPALLKLPFLLSPSVDNQKVFTVEQPNMLATVNSGNNGG